MPIRKSQKTANSANIKKELEALAGHKIDFSAEQFVKVLTYPIGAYDYTQGVLRGDGSSFRVRPVATPSCSM